MKLLFLIIPLFLLYNCTTHKGFVNYKELGVYAHGGAGNKKFEDIGPVNSSSSSWIWTSCDTVATEAVRQMLDIAKTRGANTVYKIVFETDNGRVSIPTCYKRWGWFLLYVAPGLGPWMTATSVEGIAAKIKTLTSTKNAIHIDNDSDTYKLAKDYIINLKKY